MARVTAPSNSHRVPFTDDLSPLLISVLIAEDHDVTREGLRTILTTKLDARIAATTATGTDVLDLVEKHNPDLLILDIGLPGLNGLDVLHKLQSRTCSVRVVVLSMLAEDAYVTEAFEKGASAYVVKGAPMEELVSAIRAAVNGERYLSEGLSERLLDSGSTSDAPRDRYDTLTQREREVLQLTAEGLTSREIGERLAVSPRTVDKHRENLKAKLGLRNTAELTRFYMEQNRPSTEVDASSK